MLLQNALLLMQLLAEERVLLLAEEGANAALPPALERGGEEALSQKGHLGLYRLNVLHADR